MLLCVFQKEVFMALPDERYLARDFGGEWWTEQVLPSRKAIEYLDDTVTPKDVVAASPWPRDLVKRRRRRGPRSL